MMTLAQAHMLLPGSTLVGDGSTWLQRVASDTRTLQRGDLFVALRGERFDAHDFLAQARAAGAAAALAERGVAEAGLPGLLVSDALASLQELAAAWRARLNVALIAVTGSNGKTTVTQMTAAILKAWLGAGAFWTQGNLNNHIGVPLTLLRLRQDQRLWHRAGVLELGMNHPGEIEQLARWVAPSVVLVNNAQREHQEFMSGVEAVARENGSAIAALGESGTVVVPAHDAYTPLWRELAGSRRVCSFALDAPADVSARAQWQRGRWQLSIGTPEGHVNTTVAIAGRHNAQNAVAAAAGALALGAPLDAVRQGLAAFEPVAGRSRALRLLRWGREFTLVDDSYNANPDSVLAAIDVLAELPAPRWLVLGDMGEVGAHGPEFHAEVGRHAAARRIERVWTVGTLSRHTAEACQAQHFERVDELVAALGAAAPAASVLVKGSRFMKMERVVRALQGEALAA